MLRWTARSHRGSWVCGEGLDKVHPLSGRGLAVARIRTPRRRAGAAPVIHRKFTSRRSAGSERRVRVGTQTLSPALHLPMVRLGQRCHQQQLRLRPEPAWRLGAEQPFRAEQREGALCAPISELHEQLRRRGQQRTRRFQLVPNLVGRRSESGEIVGRVRPEQHLLQQHFAKTADTERPLRRLLCRPSTHLPVRLGQQQLAPPEDQ